MNGTVKTKTEKFFGFITPEGDMPEKKDVFFHESSLVDMKWPDIQEGMKVSYDVEDSPKGLRAANVRRA